MLHAAHNGGTLWIPCNISSDPGFRIRWDQLKTRPNQPWSLCSLLLRTTFTRSYLWICINSHWRGHGDSRWFVLSESEVQRGRTCPWSNERDIYISKPLMFSYILLDNYSIPYQEFVCLHFTAHVNKILQQTPLLPTKITRRKVPNVPVPRHRLLVILLSRFLPDSPCIPGSGQCSSSQQTKVVLALSSLAFQYHLWAELMSKQKAKTWSYAILTERQIMRNKSLSIFWGGLQKWNI